jgi:hypothetical protein
LFEGVVYAFDTDTGMLLKEQDFRPEPPAPKKRKCAGRLKRTI